jgi:multiple sugar transport system substrate-binding protein
MEITGGRTIGKTVIQVTMQPTVYLKGITWNHPRGYQPLEEMSTSYLSATGVEIAWTKRSLKEFGDMPIEEFINLFDFVVLDHPYMGQASKNNLLVKLDQYLDPNFILQQEQLSVGPSFKSYYYDSSLLALPVDAAAMFAAFDEFFFSTRNIVPPTKLDELASFAGRLPDGKKVAIAFCPTDCWCVFLSICSQLTQKSVFTRSGLDQKTACMALEKLGSWKSFLHPDSYNLNAIELLDSMSTGSEIVYTPMVFGYTNYGRVGFRDKLLRFGNAPLLNGAWYSTILGGAGIAVPAASPNIEEALKFLVYLLDPVEYGSMYVKNGGQSAHLSDWQSESANALCNSFFFETLDTMKKAYLRPRIPGFNRFQEEAAEIVHSFLVNGGEAAEIIEVINSIYHEHCTVEFDMY